ncbi:crotonase/enoyl-CoA hydratase family protein [Exilibacterium tricleocarpae]|uniref:Crotonase/enoyl-CoA hydratase family protein n=1 Tax=Exilibacterium tricleocarpae TaxID=2591008 RepID=A0A545TLK3_9GAMM|nr:crotonase/enoyl-CoA hydratase family protein [Exilibacterium tricleocarpae]TQV78107.1 crotonase/enoyl-CoA hydratase family protein [Exilibacterium tricleocarpae]
MSELVSYTLDAQVATLTLNNGKVNAISPALIDAFNRALDRAESDRAVVLITGQAGMLSAGYDLKVMGESMDAAMALVEKGSTLSRRLLSFPTPVLVACSGHAVAKGAFLLLSADYRIGAAGPFKIGLNEVAIGMTMHLAGIELARARLLPAYFNRSVINAEMYDPDRAVAAGFLDQVVTAEQLSATATARAQQLAQLNMDAHRNTKLKARADLLETLDRVIEIDARGPH